MRPQDDNPYAPPQTALEPESDDQVMWYVDEKCLVVRSGARLPMRCLMTNQNAKPEDIVRKTFLWAPTFRLVLASYRFNVEYYVLRSFRRERMIRQFALSTVVLSLMVGWVFVGVAKGNIITDVMFLMLITIFGSFIYFPRGRLEIQKGDEDRIWLYGACREFLKESQDV